MFAALLTAPLLVAALVLRLRRWQKCAPSDDPPLAAAAVLPPGSLGLPYVGETLHFLLECATGEFFSKRLAKYGPIFKTHLFMSPTVMLVGPEHVKKILLGEHVLVRTIWPPSFTAVLGQGTLSMMGADQHRIYRKVSIALLRCIKILT
jgi:cytochrome P450